MKFQQNIYKYKVYENTSLMVPFPIPWSRIGMKILYVIVSITSERCFSLNISKIHT